MVLSEGAQVADFLRNLPGLLYPGGRENADFSVKKVEIGRLPFPRVNDFSKVCWEATLLPTHEDLAGFWTTLAEFSGFIVFSPNGLCSFKTLVNRHRNDIVSAPNKKVQKTSILTKNGLFCRWGLASMKRRSTQCTRWAHHLEPTWEPPVTINQGAYIKRRLPLSKTEQNGYLCFFGSKCTTIMPP